MFLRGYSYVVYLFLYAPIALIVLFSFNSGSHIVHAGFDNRHLPLEASSKNTDLVNGARRMGFITKISEVLLDLGKFQAQRCEERYAR